MSFTKEQYQQLRRDLTRYGLFILGSIITFFFGYRLYVVYQLPHDHTNLIQGFVKEGLSQVDWINQLNNNAIGLGFGILIIFISIFAFNIKKNRYGRKI